MRSMTTIYYLAHALIIAIGVAITQIGGFLWTAIGTSMVATGAAGAVIYLYLAKKTESARESLEMLSRFGISHVYDRRAAQIRDEYQSRLSNAQSNVDIIGFGLKDFRRDYMAELGALASRAHLRILLLDPNTGIAEKRDEEEGQSSGTIAAEIREFLTQYGQHYGDNQDPHLEVRLYTCLPLVNIFRIDDDLFWGPYLVGRASGNTITMRVRRGGTLF